LVKVGVLALQGDFLEHAQILREVPGAEPVYVKKPRDLAGIDALVLPGGESTTIGALLAASGLLEPVRELLLSGLPALGTCAGAVLMAKKVADRVVGETRQHLLKVMDVSVLRNAFGRQRESFEAVVSIEGLGEVRGAFIRAPAIVEAFGSAKIVGYVEHPKLGRVGAAAVQGAMMAVTFHPEITGDKKLYERLVKLAKK